MSFTEKIFMGVRTSVLSCRRLFFVRREQGRQLLLFLRRILRFAEVKKFGVEDSVQY